MSRQRRPQPQRAEPLARIVGRRPRRCLGVRALRGRARRAARGRRVRGLARARAGSRRLGRGPRAGRHGQPRAPRAAGRRRRLRAPRRRRRGRSPRRRRVVRLSRDPDGRSDAALERRLSRPAPVRRRGGGPGRGVPVPLRLRGRRRRVGLLVREPRCASALVRDPRRARSRDRRSRGGRPRRDRDRRRRAAGRRLRAARASPPPDPVGARGARGAARRSLRGAGRRVPGALARRRPHRDLGAGVPGALPALGAGDVRGHGATPRRAGARGDPGAPDRRRGDRREPLRAVQRVRRADSRAEPVRDDFHDRVHQRLRGIPPGERGPRPPRGRAARRPPRPGPLPLGVRHHELERRPRRGRAADRRERWAARARARRREPASPPQRPLVRRERPRRLHPPRDDPLGGHLARRAPGPPRGRNLQLLVGARQLQPPLPWARRVGQARRAPRGRPAARVPDALPRREPDEADVDALPEPHGDGRGGVDPRLSARRRCPARRLRQDGSRAADGRGERRRPGDHGHGRARRAGRLPRTAAGRGDRPVALRGRAARGADEPRGVRRARGGRDADVRATATRWGPRRR